MQLHLLAIFLPAVLCARTHVFDFLSQFPPKFCRPTTPTRPKVVFDLHTLCPHGIKLQKSYEDASLGYVQKTLAMDESKAKSQVIWYEAFHHTVPNGLMVEKNIDPNDYEAFLDKNINYQDIHHDQALVNMLTKLRDSFDIIILTDTTPKHADKVLAIMGATSLVDMIFTSVPGETNLPLKEAPTHSISAFDRVTRFLYMKDSKQIIYVDIFDRYLYRAAFCGWKTIKLDEFYVPNGRSPHVPTIKSIFNLPQVLESSKITPEKE